MMMAKVVAFSLALSVALAVFITPCSAFTFLDSEAILLTLDAYLRNDLVIFRNIVDLDNAISDDSTVYAGIDYNLALTLHAKESDAIFYVKAERNGPYDYDAPLFVHNTLMTSGGVIEHYRGDALLPELEEFWFDLPVGNASRVKAGLYLYEVGNGFALNGSYENYGLSYTLQSGAFAWRLYYCRPDVNRKNHLGPRVRQDEEQGIDYNHGAANFFAADLKYDTGSGYLWPYVGVLADYTSADKRDNTFITPVNRDILGTIGAAFRKENEKGAFSLEYARNFGRAESIDPVYGDIEHSGYLAYVGGECYVGKFTPSLQFLAASGNKATPEMALAGDANLLTSKNRGFNYYSPMNLNLGDAISSSNVDMLPIVAMGGGYGLNYGVPRPGTFSPGDFENLLMPCLGAGYKPSDRLDISVFFYYLNTFERPVG
ncbi:MAG: hypothetical protein PHR11_01505, partial [Candidatus Omnitrophica bacterium]|nr:hypothetical protein [Candidatus Omnitrophota bacterium]